MNKVLSGILAYHNSLIFGKQFIKSSHTSLTHWLCKYYMNTKHEGSIHSQRAYGKGCVTH